MKKLLLLPVFSTLIFFVSCENKGEPVKSKKLVEKDSIPNQPQIDTTVIADDVEKIDSLEQKIIDHGLVDVQSLNSRIFVDLKYSTEDNFIGYDMYGSLTKAYLQPEIARRLSIAQDSLTSIDTSLHLLVYDAVRPRSVQWLMWKAMDTLAIADRVKFVSNPKNGSVHNYGCAVDLTICSSSNEVLDMGANYDDLRRIAYPKYEKEFLKSGELSDDQLKNRILLRKVMGYGGFRVLTTEWWHFNGLSRKAAKTKYKAVE